MYFYDLFLYQQKKGAMAKRYKKRKPSKKISFKLSHQQNSSLQNYCKQEKLTPNKFIKTLLKSYVEDYTDEKMGKYEIDARQLTLFHEPKSDDYQQLSIFG